MPLHAVQFSTELALNQEIFAISYGFAGIDYIMNPTEDKVMVGKVTGFELSLSEEKIELKGYKAKFNYNGKQQNYSFFPVNIGVFIFTSRQALESEYEKRRKEHFQANPNRQTNTRSISKMS
jgi:hypothetical protein